ILISSEEGMIRKYDSLKKALRKAHERGVKIKFISPITAKSQKILPEIQKIADVKNKNMNGRMCIIDNKHVTFFVSEEGAVHPSYDVGVWVNTKQFGSMLTNLVNTSIKN
ncbi:MAG: hypothetical protein V1743_06630, partial [Nanoarchaeota archaeon]